MRAEDTLQFLMDFYGDIYYSRQQCLDHLFCTIGNGYEWQNGELVCEDELLSRWTLKEPIKHAEPSALTKELGYIKTDMLKLRGLEDEKWYPISKEYSYICNYPDDIKPDWLALIEECKQMLIADGIEVPENQIC